MRDGAKRDAEIVVAEAHAEARAILRRARAECEQLAREAGRIRLILHSALDALDEADELDPEVHDVDDDEARPAEAA